MPRYSDYNETAVVRGGYVPRRLNVQGPSIEVFSHALDKIDARHKEALAERNKIMAAIGQLDLNEAEDEFKIDYIRDIQNQIDAASEFGGYSTALTTATQLAGNVLADPKITGRVRAQQNYKNFVETTRKRTDISDDIKDWAIAKNPYHYEDKIDANGNVIGGSKWEPGVTPVSTVSNAAILDKVKSWVEADEGSSVSNIRFDGNDVAYQVKNEWKRLTADKLQKALDLAFETVPGAKASLHQDYQVAEWKYNNLSDDEKNQANLIASDIIAPNGEKYTEKQYLQKRFQGFTDVMGYNKSGTEIQYNTAYSSLLDSREIAKQEAMANGAGGAGGNLINSLGIEKPSFSHPGGPVVIDTSDRFNQAFADTNKAITEITKRMMWNTNSKWQNYIQSGDYVGAAEYMSDYLKKYGGASPMLVQNMQPYLTTLMNSGSRLQDLTQGADKNTQDAISFSAAYDANGVLPPNNSYSIAFNNAKNKYGGENSVATRYDLNDGSRVKDMLDRMGFSNESQAKQAGIVIGFENGRRYIQVDKNNRYWNKAREAFNNTSDPFFHLPWNESKVVSIDANGNKIKTKSKNEKYNIPGVFKSGVEAIAGFNALTKAAYSLIQGNDEDMRLDNIINSANSKRQGFNNTTHSEEDVMEVQVYELPGVAEAKRKVANNILTYDQGRAEEEDIKKMILGGLQGTDWQQVKVYAYDEKTKMKRELTNEERGKFAPYLTAMCADNETKIEWADMQICDGLYISPAGRRNAKGEYVPFLNEANESYIVVSDRLTDQAINRYRRDTARQAAVEYNSRKGHGANYRMTDGTLITNIANEGAMIDGSFTPATDVVKMMDADQIVKKTIINAAPIAASYKQKGEPIPDVLLNNIIAMCMQAAQAEGYDVRLTSDNKFADVDAHARVMKHYNTIMNNIQ